MEQSAQVGTDIETCKNCCLIIVGNCIYFCDFLLCESFSRPHQSSQCCHSAVWVFRIWLPKLNAQRSFQLKYNFTGQCFMVIVALSGRLLKCGLLAEGIGGERDNMLVLPLSRLYIFCGQYDYFSNCLR